MIVYNKAFDLYHTIYRILHLLSNCLEKESITVERVRIWDYYVLFPQQVYSIRLLNTEKQIRELRKEFIKKKNNPFTNLPPKKRLFLKLQPYQISALNCIASYGIIDKDSLRDGKIKIIDKELLANYIQSIGEISRTESNIISLMTGHFNIISMYGKNGLKSRTQLMESIYDA